MKAFHLLPHFFISCLIFLTACSSNQQEKDIVAQINDISIPTSELKKEITRYANQNPGLRITSRAVNERLRTLIEQKLMIQEAVKKGITKEERFVEAIKTFWVQTLIRDLIEAKNKEWGEKLFVTDGEIRKEYERMMCCPRICAVRAGSKLNADEIAKKMREGKHPEGEEILGPLFYDDIKGTPLANAFDMKTGEIKVIPTKEEEHIVLAIIERKTITLPPLKAIYNDIKDSVLIQKKQKALMEWIEGVNKSAKITINEKKLKEIANE